MAPKEKPIEVHVADVKRHEGPIMLPETLSTEKAIEVLQRKLQYDNEDVRISERVNAFVWDGALALKQALEELYGLALQESKTFEFFGQKIKIPPTVISIPSGPNETVAVPWGQFHLPGINGHVETGYMSDSRGRIIFNVGGQVKHKDEPAIKKLLERTREIAREKSIYRSKALEIRFKNEKGKVHEIVTPNFLALSDMTPIFSKDLETAIDRLILAPIRFTEFTKASGVPLKRGALLGGVYGTGKTLTADYVARIAIQHGWTYFYLPDINELAEGLRFAQHFQPCVVFAEDIDRLAGMDRTDAVNELLNTIDGIGSKSDRIMTIVTSNHPEQINKAMRRKGRIDAILEIAPPDADAVQRLLRLYGGASIAQDESLEEVGVTLAGQIPATIREVVERSKLYAIGRTEGTSAQINQYDLLGAAKAVLQEQKLFAEEPEKMHPVHKIGHELITQTATEVHNRLKPMLDDIYEKAENGS